MENFNHADAVAVVKAALESNSIKLKGSENAPDQNAAIDRANIDVAYLLTLFRKLQGLSG